MSVQETGTVKWFNDIRGYGFIVRDSGGEVFVHYSAIQCEDGKCSLEKGERVEFVTIDGPRGPQAQYVVVVQ